jgi:hypothetical protein
MRSSSPATELFEPVVNLASSGDFGECGED